MSAEGQPQPPEIDYNAIMQNVRTGIENGTHRQRSLAETVHELSQRAIEAGDPDRVGHDIHMVTPVNPEAEAAELAARKAAYAARQARQQ